MSTAVANKDTTVTIRDRLKSPALIAEIGKAMPQHCSPERMARAALTAITKVPKLADCTEASFFQCLLNLSQWGLEPDGRRAHLIPYGNVCTLIIDYKGYVELAYRSGVVKSIHADVVRDGDIFDFDRGTVARHTPWFLRRDPDKPKEPGQIYAVYCFVELAHGAEKSEVLSRDEVEKIRKRSKAGNNGPWVTDWEEMAKKTAFRRVSKWLPLSAEIHDAFEKDADKLDPIAVAAKAPVSIDSLSAMLEGPTTEQADEQPQDDLPDTSYEPEPERDDWTMFVDAVAAAKSLADLTCAGDYWLAKDFGAKRNTEALQIVADREKVIRSSKGKPKQGQLMDATPTA